MFTFGLPFGHLEATYGWSLAHLEVTNSWTTMSTYSNTKYP
ncbi:hypothetical protein [Pasteurella phage vB_PmuP_PS07]|nr:hypothetical protein [Pasteurella phage vB_PmuP_PS07]